MKIKSVINGNAEPQETRIEIPIKGGSGELGIHAIENLVKTINGLKRGKTKQDVIGHFYVIVGYAMCCRDCGFLEEESMKDLINMADHLSDNELARVRQEEEKRRGRR